MATSKQRTIYEAFGSLYGCVAHDDAVNATVPDDIRNVSQLRFVEVWGNFQDQFWFLKGQC